MNMNKRKIVFGDPHGNYWGVQNILDQINYNKETDKLIFTGDYVDGFNGNCFDVKQLIELLLTLDNAYFVLGNHDSWMFGWISSYNKPAQQLWYQQGGRETLQTYGIMDAFPTYAMYKNLIPDSHVNFLNNLLPAYIDEDIVVVHGGLGCLQDMQLVKNGNYSDEILWNRSFYKTSVKSLLQCYKEEFGNKIFICGHTPHGPIINENPKRILIDGGSRGGGKLHAVIIENGEVGDIIKEQEYLG